MSKHFIFAALIAAPMTVYAQGISSPSPSAPAAAQAPVIPESAATLRDAQQIPIVTLEEAIALAHQNAQQMRNARNSLRTASLGVTTAYAAFLPSISTNAGFTPAQNGQLASYNAGISAGMSAMFDYNTYFAVGRAKRSREVAEASLITAQYSTQQTIKSQYFAALQQAENLTNAQRSLVISEENLKIAAARVRNGSAIANDSINAMIQVLNSRNAVTQAENNLANSHRTLSRSIGIETVVRPNPQDTASFRLVQLDSALLFGMLEDSPTMVQQRANIADRKYSLRTARLSFLPRPQGSLSWNRQGSGQGVWGYSAERYQYTGGDPRISFSVSLAVFNGFGREAQLVSAVQGLETQEQSFRDARLNQQYQFYNLLATIKNLEQQMRIQEEQLALQEKNYEITEARFQLDLQTYLDVMNAQNALLSLRNTIVNTKFNYRNQIAQLEAMLGRDIR